MVSLRYYIIARDHGYDLCLTPETVPDVQQGRYEAAFVHYDRLSQLLDALLVPQTPRCPPQTSHHRYSGLTELSAENVSDQFEPYNTC